MRENQIIIYNTEDGQTKIDLKVSDETVWLNQIELAELFQTTKNNISLHIKNIFEDEELDKQGTVKEFLTVQKEGEKKVERYINYYSLDMILAIGYRVRSSRGVEFRRWANKVLKEYLLEGASLNDDKLRAEPDVFKEILQKIRDIRTSEAVFYKQVLDIFATSIDYNGKSELAQEFFKTVQNKMLYAVSGKTAAELIFMRLDGQKEYLGLTNFKGEFPTKAELGISKNYLGEKELNQLNLMVSAFLDLAELRASEEEAMTMQDWVLETDRYLDYRRKDVLNDAGKISHETAMKKVNQVWHETKILGRVEKDFLQNVQAQAKRLESKGEDD
jgi:hypothetical protein